MQKDRVTKPDQIEDRYLFALNAIRSLGITPFWNNWELRFEFEFNRHTVFHYPYTGWHTGKSIKDGRGINNLLKQLKNGKNNI